uniref:Uncharacterized protein n=5 Tax=Aegilops tauschii subsp. strangulata TaxID=200361 RepID=A0A453KGQ5_AEGTS
MPPTKIARAQVFFQQPMHCTIDTIMFVLKTLLFFLINLESHHACIFAFAPLIFQCIGANAAFGVGEAQATCCKRQMVTYSRRRGSQVFFRQFQFSRAVAIIVRLPTGGTTMALCSSHIRSLGGWSFPVT